MIVVLRTPSVAERVARTGFASEAAERRWTAEAFAAQQQVLTQLARHGLTTRPDYSYARVLDGFSAALDPRAVALLEREPGDRRRLPGPGRLPGGARDRSRRARPPVCRPSGCRASTAPGSRSRSSTRASISPSPTSAAGSSPGSTSSAAPPRRPRSATRRARTGPSGTEPSSPACSSAPAGPTALHGVAPGATVLPIRVAGWQPTAERPRRGLCAHRPADRGARAGGRPERRRRHPRRRPDRAARGGRAVRLVPRQPRGPGGRRCARPRRARRRAGRQRRRRRPALRLDRGPGGLAGGADRRRGRLPPGRPRRSGSSSARGSPSSPTRRCRCSARRRRRSPLDLGLAAPGAPGALQGQGGARAGRRRTRPPPWPRRSATAPQPCSSTAARCRRAPSATRPFPWSASRRRRARTALARDPAALPDRRDARPGDGRPRTRPLGRVAPFSSRGLTFGGLLAPQLDRTRGRDRDLGSGPGPATGSRRSPTVTGTSAAAAAVAGAAALLAAGAAGPLGGRSRRASSPARPGRSVPAAAPSITGASGRRRGGGLGDGPLVRAVERARAGARRPRSSSANVSSRRLRLSARRRAPPSSRPSPASLVLAPGAVGDGAGDRAALSTARRSPVVGGALAVRPRGGQALRIPWAIVFHAVRRRRSSGPRAIAPAVVRAVRHRSPAVLHGRRRAGRRRARVSRSSRSRGSTSCSTPAAAPTSACSRARRDLLPGAYSFGLTGRGPRGATLAPGSYQIRLIAWPVLGGRGEPGPGRLPDRVSARPRKEAAKPDEHCRREPLPDRPAGSSGTSPRPSRSTTTSSGSSASARRRSRSRSRRRWTTARCASSPAGG